MVNNISPRYLSSLINLLSSEGTYRLRNYDVLKVCIPICKSEGYKTSFIPSTINLWNSLNLTVRSCRTVNILKKKLRIFLFPERIKNIYSSWYGDNWTNLSRMRMGMSGLGAHLFIVHIVDSPICKYCHTESETPHHFINVCSHFNNQRISLYNLLRNIQTLYGMNMDEIVNDTSILLFGSPKFSNAHNFKLLRAVSQYIGDTKRFYR